MKIALIGNKQQSNHYDLSEYDYIVRVNNCDSLNQTYTDKTDVWFFGGNDNVFRQNVSDEVVNYINNNVLRRLVCKPHNVKQKISSETEDVDGLIKEYCNIINYQFDEKLLRITTAVRTILHILYETQTKYIIDIYCLDKDRKDKNPWHKYPEEEYQLLDYLEQNNYIRFIK